MTKRVSDFYNTPKVRRQRAGNDIDTLYIIEMAHKDNPKDIYFGELQFTLKEDTLENVATDVAEMMYAIMNKLQKDINIQYD